VLLVTLAKQDVVKYYHVRLVLLLFSSLSHPGFNADSELSQKGPRTYLCLSRS
jgi:hypothetical protein